MTSVPIPGPHEMGPPHRDTGELPPLGRMWCVAKSKQRQAPCLNLGIPGGSVCYIHGGRAPATVRNAEQRLAEAKIRSDVADRVAEVAAAAAGVHPIETMERARSFAHGMMEVLAEELAQSDLDGTGEYGVDESVRAKLLHRWTDLAMRAGKTSADAGIDERRQQLGEAQAQEVVRVLGAASAALLALVCDAVPEAAPRLREVWEARALTVVADEVRRAEAT